MKKWYEEDDQDNHEKHLRAIAYYRHSSQIGQENSVEIQQDYIKKFAKENGIFLIEEFEDRGKSGLNAEGRPGFLNLMDKVKNNDDFKYVFVLDMTRWGRFQDTDLSAHYESMCTQHGKRVIYTDMGFPKEEEHFIHQLRKTIARHMAAEYSRALSVKVLAGCKKVASQGYRPGGTAPYGMHRLMLNEKKERDRILQPSERKSIQNARVILVPGDPNEVEVVIQIFTLFTKGSLSEKQIAGQLNKENKRAPAGGPWTSSSVHNILSNQQYAGCVVYNKTSQTLKGRSRKNPKEDWIVTSGAYEPVITMSLFEEAEKKIQSRKIRYGRAEMLERLKSIMEKYGCITGRLVDNIKEIPVSSTYSSRFGSMSQAFNEAHPEIINKIKEEVCSTISNSARIIDTYDDFIVINNDYSVKIQPVLPLPAGYRHYWNIYPDMRENVDITLGVPLSPDDHGEILGYIALPRLMVTSKLYRITQDSEGTIEMFGHAGLDFLKEFSIEKNENNKEE